MSYPAYPENMLPPRSQRKPKRIRVRPHRYGNSTLTYHIYGKRPKRGTFVRIHGGLYDGLLGTVSWRWSLYRGATYLAQIAHPKGWT